jgi:hypothetical protein
MRNNLLAKSDSVFKDVGKVQLIPQTFGWLRIVELTIQNGFHPVEGLPGSLQAKLGLTLYSKTETKNRIIHKKNVYRKNVKNKKPSASTT